jgi:hypothetical protein
VSVGFLARSEWGGCMQTLVQKQLIISSWEHTFDPCHVIILNHSACMKLHSRQAPLGLVHIAYLGHQ